MTGRKAPPHAFKKGTSGNPAGKRPGVRNRATQAVMALLEGELEEVTRTCIEAAKAGDMTAIRLILERLAPPARERPLCVPLPSVATVEGIAEAQAAVVEAVAVGDLLPTEGTTLSTILENRRKSLESMELEARIVALEVASNADKT